jgi:hypothetical protein
VNAEQRILVWLERADFDGTGCRWSQENIAAACQCSRRTVIRITQKLAAEGRIDSFLERRPGCKWPCRVYRVKHWNPHKRAGVLNVLRAIREARQAECHTERTAKASKGSDPVGRPVSPRCTSLVNQRCGRERFQIRRSTCMDQSRRRHPHVADITCLHCAEKDVEIEQLRGIRETLQRELNKSMENEAGALAAAKAAGNALIAAKAQITREQKRSVKAGQVQQVVDHWRLLRPRTGPEFGEPGSKSFAVIEKALVLMASDPAGAVTACCEAIDGLHMAPWMSYGKRYATPGQGRVLRRDLEHALGDEQRIQKCRQILRWLRAGGAERAWEIYQAVQETEAVLRAEVMDLLGEQRFRREEPADWFFVEVEGVRTRVSEKTEKATRENGEQA